jgi:hypothetical protein
MATIPIGIQYVTDEEGKPTGVIVPIDLWREIVSEQETAHLLKSVRRCGNACSPPSRATRASPSR